MSHHFKRPKPSGPSLSKRIGKEARMQQQLIQQAKLIETPDQLDAILAQAPSKAIAQAFLELVRPHLKVQPRQLAAR